MITEFKIQPNVQVTSNNDPFNPIDVFYDKAVGAFVIPPFFVPSKHDIITRNKELRQIKKLLSDNRLVHSIMPLMAKRNSDSEWWTFPIEPLVSVQCSNKIVRRNVFKSLDAGSIKERWTQDDWKVTITGTFINTDNEIPKGDVLKLLDMFNACEAINLQSDFLQMIGISSIAIETIDLPTTTGLEAQVFSITGYSDKFTQLLISE